VAVVNQAFVKNLFKPGENPIGHRMGTPDGPGDFEIVGVVEDTSYTTVRWQNHAMAFLAPTQRSPSAGPIEKDDSLYAGAIVLQTERPMGDMESLARKTLAGINPNLTVVKFQTFTEQIGNQFSEERLISRLTTLFGGLALLLAALGLYGVTAYNVVRRTSEIGIRMALGAERRGVIAMVMRGAMIQTLLGLAIGIPVVFLCLRYVKSQLYQFSNMDAGVLAGSIAVLAVAACVAGIIPARRAASIDPVQALRME
jgi:ABC-type antimicrobial peptide transport system permease subunit